MSKTPIIMNMGGPERKKRERWKGSQARIQKDRSRTPNAALRKICKINKNKNE